MCSPNSSYRPTSRVLCPSELSELCVKFFPSVHSSTLFIPPHKPHKKSEPLTPAFSVQASYSFGFFFTLAEISPATAHTYEKWVGVPVCSPWNRHYSSYRPKKSQSSRRVIPRLFGDGQIDHGGRRHARSRRRRLVDHRSVRPLWRAYRIQFALQRN